MRAILLLLVAGCGGTPSMPDMAADLATGAPPDFAQPPDLAPPADLVAHPLVWTNQSTNTGGEDYYDVWGVGPGDVFLVGVSNIGGLVYHTSDGGRSWLQQGSSSTNRLEAVWGSENDDLFCVGAQGTVVHSANDGASWSRVSPMLMPAVGLHGVVGALAGGDVWATGDAGTIWRSFNGGLAWSKETTPTGNDLARPWRNGATADVWAVGAKGTILHLKGGGAWNAETSGTTNDLTAVWGSSAMDVWAVGAAGTVLHTSDGGATWKTVGGPWMANRVGGVWGASATNLFVAVDTVGVVNSTDGGATWSVVSGGNSGWTAVWGSGPYDVFAVGKAGLIVHGS